MGRVRVARAAGLAALVAAALLGACTVEVEGAPCRVPGATADCPGGQACGNDLRCSERALACASAGARCTPGVGGACLDPGGLETTGAVAQARRCTADDPVCGTWIVEPCAAGGLSCAVRAPAGGVPGAWCACPDQPPGSRELFVRPEGSSRAAAPFATGAAAPVACSFRRLTDALGAAGDIVAEPAAVATVTAVGAGAGETRTFSAAATGEAYPLVVPGRVTLGSDALAGGGTYEIVFDAVGAATAAVELHSAGGLAGFTVRNGAGDAARNAIDLRCDGRPDPAVLTSVVLDGAGAGSARLGRGVVVDGTCGVAAAGTQFRDFSVAGAVLDSAAGAQLALTGGSISGCGDGVVLRNGRLLLETSRISGNAGMGVRADDITGIPRVEIRKSKVVGNADTGVALVNATSEVRITETTVSGNGAVTLWGGFPLSVSRRAGGMVFQGTPPASGSYEFARNRIYSNKGDQVLVLGTSSTWVLDGPTTCGSDASGPLYSVIGCYDPTSVGTTYGVVAVNANASVRYAGWQTITPNARDDVQGFTGSVAFSPFCPADSTLSCTSEDPVRP